jgi:hypothetical protein
MQNADAGQTLALGASMSRKGQQEGSLAYRAHHVLRGAEGGKGTVPDRIIQLRLSDEVENLSFNPPPSARQPPLITCRTPLIMIISCHHDKESHLI